MNNTRLSRRRLGTLLVVFAIAFCAVGARTLWLESVRGPSLAGQAELQQRDVQTIAPIRGDIVDRNGQQLAVSEEADDIFANPKLISHPAVVAAKLAHILHMKQQAEAALASELGDRSRGFVYVQRQVPKQLADNVQTAMAAAKVKGVGLDPVEKRIYPLHDVAAKLLGFVGVDNKGIAGLELMYNKSLSGVPGRSVTVRDPTGVPIDVLSLQQEVDGRRVKLTIDSTIQNKVQSVLRATVKKFHAKGAIAIVLNPRTGETYAMASMPMVDANNFSHVSPAITRNRAITDSYEPGSTFKIVTISAALEDHLVSPSTSFYLKNCVRVADKCIQDAETHRPPEWMTVKQILVRSSNVGTITIAMKLLGSQHLASWIKRFGFGQPTGIDFPGDTQTPGIVPVPNTASWSGTTIGNLPIGQGILVTPMQIVDAYAAIANGGVMVQPHLLKKVSGEPAPKYPSRRVISAATAATMRSIFGSVVTSEDGTGTAARVPGYAVAGKTGTASIAINGHYSKTKYNASFVGFAPAKNPQLVTYVLVNQPDVPWGGTAAAPAFEEITSFALQYLGIPPDGVR